MIDTLVSVILDLKSKVHEVRGYSATTLEVGWEMYTAMQRSLPSTYTLALTATEKRFLGLKLVVSSEPGSGLRIY